MAEMCLGHLQCQGLPGRMHLGQKKKLFSIHLKKQTNMGSFSLQLFQEGRIGVLKWKIGHWV